MGVDTPCPDGRPAGRRTGLPPDSTRDVMSQSQSQSQSQNPLHLFLLWSVGGSSKESELRPRERTTRKTMDTHDFAAAVKGGAR